MEPLFEELLENVSQGFEIQSSHFDKILEQFIFSIVDSRRSDLLGGELLSFALTKEVSLTLRIG